MTASAGHRASLDRLALLVRLGPGLHAVPVRLVEEVLPDLPIEPLPDAVAGLRGVVFVRGHVIPVLDLRQRLGVAGPRADDPHLVCVRVGGRLVALEVDEALDLIDVDPAAVVGPAALGTRDGPFRGLIERDGRVIRLLDPERLL